MHNTPPPTQFNDGSFNAQLKEELEIVPAGGRFHHRCIPTDATPPFIAHVRVLRGNGDALYFDDAAENSVIRIELEQDDRSGPTGDLEIMGGADFFQINCDSRLIGPNPGRKHRKKYEHPGKGGDFHISRITVEKPAGTVKFDVIAPDDEEEEYTIMVWHIGDPHPHEAESMV